MSRFKLNEIVRVHDMSELFRIEKLIDEEGFLKIRNLENDVLYRTNLNNLIKIFKHTEIWKDLCLK